MRELGEHNVMMHPIIEDWIKTKKVVKAKPNYFGASAGVTCSDCGRELDYTGGKEHRLGPFWDYEVACEQHGRQGVKCVQYENVWLKEFEDPPREYNLIKEDYSKMKILMKNMLTWIKKEQPKGACDTILTANINDEFHMYIASNGVLIFEIDGRRLFISKETKDKIKRIFKNTGGKIEDSWNDEDLGDTMTIKLAGNIKALEQFDMFYHKGCQRKGTFMDGEKKKEHDRSVFCNCSWLGDANKKVIRPEGWE